METPVSALMNVLHRYRPAYGRTLLLGSPDGEPRCAAAPPLRSSAGSGGVHESWTRPVSSEVAQPAAASAAGAPPPHPRPPSGDRGRAVVRLIPVGRCPEGCHGFSPACKPRRPTGINLPPMTWAMPPLGGLRIPL